MSDPLHSPEPTRTTWQGRIWQRRRDLPLLISAAAWLFVAWLALDVLPGKLYRRLLQPRLNSRCEAAEQTSSIARVEWAISAASRRVPWRTVCFHQGIAAQHMLCSRGIPATLHYGVAKSDLQALEAHVWVQAGEICVVGGVGRGRFTQMHVYLPSSPGRETSPAPSASKRAGYRDQSPRGRRRKSG